MLLIHNYSSMENRSLGHNTEDEPQPTSSANKLPNLLETTNLKSESSRRVQLQPPMMYSPAPIPSYLCDPYYLKPQGQIPMSSPSFVPGIQREGSNYTMGRFGRQNMFVDTPTMPATGSFTAPSVPATGYYSPLYHPDNRQNIVLSGVSPGATLPSSSTLPLPYMHPAQPEPHVVYSPLQEQHGNTSDAVGYQNMHAIPRPDTNTVGMSIPGTRKGKRQMEAFKSQKSSGETPFSSSGSFAKKRTRLPFQTGPPRLIYEEDVEYLEFDLRSKQGYKRYRLKCPSDIKSGIAVRLFEKFGNDVDKTIEFKVSNCIYPGALVSKTNYQGKRYNYETFCNEVGWFLVMENPDILTGDKGLIQKAVDMWRNTRLDDSQRSRKARKIQDIENSRKQLYESRYSK